MERRQANAWAGLLALAAMGCPGCSSQAPPAGPATRPGAERPQTRAGTKAAASSNPAASKPAEPTTQLPVARLLAYLEDSDPNTRLYAAVALGRLGEPEAMWPLTRTGANDSDPNVRLAAAEGVTWLWPDPSSWLCRAVRQRLLARKIKTLSVRDIEFRDLVSLLYMHADTSVRINWRTLHAEGVDPSRGVSVDWPAVPLTEALCRACAVSGGQMCFYVARSGPLFFTSASDFAGQVRGTRRSRARRAAMRTWSASNEAGRRTLETLDSSVRFPSLDGAKLVDVIQYLRERTGVDFVADWPELREARVKKTTLIRARWYPMAGMKMASALPPGEAGLRALLAAACREAYSHAELEHVVDGEVVFISTRKGAERRMAGGGSPMPRLVPSRQDEEKQAIARLVAAREHRDPLVRRSAAWALKELR